MATINSLILMYFMVSLERMGEICCHSSVFLIIPIPTHNNSLHVNLKISIFRFAHPNLTINTEPTTRNTNITSWLQKLLVTKSINGYWLGTD